MRIIYKKSKTRGIIHVYLNFQSTKQRQKLTKINLVLSIKKNNLKQNFKEVDQTIEFNKPNSFSHMPD